MFNSHLRDFDEDPFFSSDPFRAHNEHVQQMMQRSFSDPFGGHFMMPSLMDGRHGHRGARPAPAQQSSSAVALRDEHRGMSQSMSPAGSSVDGQSTGTGMMNPFSMIDNMMFNMQSRMGDMNRNFENAPTDSNAHSFSSSSVMTYSKVGNGPPKVFQSSSQTRRAPGGIKETREALRDSESGLQKMAIGHHIQDRGHVVERKENHKTGEKELNQDFQNLDESEAQSFDEEFQREVSKFQSSVPLPRLQQAPPKPRAVHRAALTGPQQAHRERTKPKAEGRKQAHFSDLHVNGSGVTKQ